MEQNYAGDVSAEQAWEVLEQDPDAVLLDVRTIPEFQFVGVPDLSALGKDTQLLPWQVYPQMQVNPDFVATIKQLGLREDQSLYILCRSGVRSVSAAIALTAQGYNKCFNILHGFEGPADERGHRGKIAGWKAAGIPWKQN
ncbi:rhodanese-like domain-containing protein [Kiloniella majae]|uniref:rhodanese-like domain-containing protein n=1 Tax=Kiloniella majae TaxID=1938558 RepID=UPI000A2784F2|nr:rhodanese-like domain-containing protein [Kiloniella majae]